GLTTGLIRQVGSSGSTPGTVRNLEVRGAIPSGSTAGLLVNTFRQGLIQDCHAAGTVTGNGSPGGLVGRNLSGVIERGSSAVDVLSSGTGQSAVGGLAGSNGGTIVASWSTGSVTVTGSSQREVGG